MDLDRIYTDGTRNMEQVDELIQELQMLSRHMKNTVIDGYGRPDHEVTDKLKSQVTEMDTILTLLDLEL